MSDGRHNENRFVVMHESAANRPISVKCCMEKQFFSAFRQWDKFKKIFLVGLSINSMTFACSELYFC